VAVFEIVRNLLLRSKSLMNSRSFVRFGIGLLGAFSVAQATSAQVSLQTVSNVDLNRYTGRWYEIAKYPNRFERMCDRNVTATYAFSSGGKISVVNACTTREGKLTQSSGWAKVVDQKTGSKLKVTFFWPFFGDYWIIDLGPNYENAVVGEPSRKYLWILSRTAKMDDKQYAEIASRLAAKGYDATKLERIKQTD
jgi:apolipoprotein D and lipocalin family protein